MSISIFSTDFDPQRKYVDGILSFTKGCSQFDMYSSRSTSYLQQQSMNPSVYTKLSCFLPWIAEQYNMEYEASSGTDAECEAGVGDRTDIAQAGQCRTSWQYEGLGEELCQFPFYWNGKLHEQCIMLEEDDAILPVFRCPIRNTVNKINGINAWTYEDFDKQMRYGGLCISDRTTSPWTVDPAVSIENCLDLGYGVFQPCKNNCAGGMVTLKNSQKGRG